MDVPMGKYNYIYYSAAYSCNELHHQIPGICSGAYRRDITKSARKN
ncbi:hypothetical protein CHRYSEO8AT_330054 [Chryseobacterium sp. 8AT]|nr:hypothetical protein CHRYSEO8AT_330054 [Chryseobacterium sp. 8AT]